ncbi:MAG: LLM class flavin-dependent oxidoreductase, partial [Actinobacteria bacterium]|nr:LLM class flavin-dependent oxidoreductase [Actinomycetota bacterium]
MKIGLFDSRAADGATLDSLIASAASAHDGGFDSWWIPQIFGYEALSVLAVVGHAVPDIALGTAVVPTYPRHPMTMAQLALTVQA